MSNKVVVGIFGSGVVGTATGAIFEQLCPDFVDVIYYDKYKKGLTENLDDLITKSNFIFICLPTPMKSTGEAKMDFVEDAVSQIASREEYDPIIIIRSTSVSGSTDAIAEKYPNSRIAFCPEFLTERNSIKDSVSTNRVVIGANEVSIARNIHDLFYLAFSHEVIYIFLSRKEAETLKYFSNCFLTAQVMFANELYFICKEIGVDYDKVRRCLIYDKRIGTFTQVPGHDGDFGVGGRCFPKDFNAFRYLAKKNGCSTPIMDTMMLFNDKIRKNRDWEEIPGAVEHNNNFEE